MRITPTTAARLRVPSLGRGGDWRARAQRSRGADRIRAEAARLDRTANRYHVPQEDQAA